jgi:hypothetical protein
MARRIATWPGFAVLCAVAGCEHLTAVRPLTPEKEAEINEVVAGRVAEITIQGEPGTLVGKDVRLDGNRVHLRASDPASPQGEAWLPETEKPLASVRQIEVRHHGGSVLNGLAIGASFGAVVGAIALIGVKNGDECYTCYAAVPLVGGAAVAFGLLGALMGAGIGAPKTIEFKDAPLH